jgi:hypothetical protein
MRGYPFALLTCLALAPSMAAQGQNLYVPLTSYAGDGTVLELVATNPDPEVTRLFSGAIFAEGQNGLTATGTPTEQVGVVPGATRVIVAPQGIGVWRLKGHAGLQLSARLRVPGASSQHQGDAVPIMSADTVHPAGATVEVQSLIAASGYLSDFGLWNAGQAQARCEARVRLANGTQVGPSFVLSVAPLSFNLFEKVPTNLVAGSQASDVRVSMTCDQPFFVLGRTVNPQTGYVSIHTGATPFSAGLPDPGSSPPPPPPPPPPPTGNAPPAATQMESFTRPGTFFTATVAVPSLLYELPVTPNVAFSELALSFDFVHGGWDPVAPQSVMNVAYLTRGAFTGDVFALITARGPAKNVVRNEITVDLPQGVVAGKVAGASLQPGTKYHVDYVYRPAAERWTLTISNSLGPVVNLQGFTSGPVWTRNGTWKILFSDVPSEGHASNLGWIYSDLDVEWRP